MDKGVDYSWGRPNVGCLRSWGYRFAMRYVALGSASKLLTWSEARNIISNGLSIVCLAEAQANAALGGYGVGYDHGKRSDVYASATGMPPDRPIYFAVDFDAQSWHMDTIAAYLNGCAAAIGRDRVGVYGGIRTIDAMAQRNAARWFYQTYAWSGGRWSPWTHVQQYLNGQTVCGGLVDLDRATALDYGQWGQTAAAPAPPATPAPPDPSGLPDVKQDGPWDYTPHVQAVSDTFEDVATTLEQHSRAVDGLRFG